MRKAISEYASVIASTRPTALHGSHDIDHINMDRADNRWENLREATRAQNAANTRAHVTNTSTSTQRF